MPADLLETEYYHRAEDEDVDGDIDDGEEDAVPAPGTPAAWCDSIAHAMCADYVDYIENRH